MHDEQLKPNLTLHLIEIPSGLFHMGADLSDSEATSNELPKRVVRLGGFHIGKHPVTKAQWNFVVQLPRMNRELFAEYWWMDKPTHPAVNVGWEDAIEFCARLSAFTGHSYRLPSEAEWEYACRAGTVIPYTVDPQTINCCRDPIDRGSTTPVGVGQANPWGVHDMHGNVWEWCSDQWHENYIGAPINGKPWIGDLHRAIDGGARWANRCPRYTSTLRVIRGGSWSSGLEQCRSTSRRGSPYISNFTDFGFRLVCELGVD